MAEVVVGARGEDGGGGDVRTPENAIAKADYGRENLNFKLGTGMSSTNCVEIG